MKFLKQRERTQQLSMEYNLLKLDFETLEPLEDHFLKAFVKKS